MHPMTRFVDHCALAGLLSLAAACSPEDAGRENVAMRDIGVCAGGYVESLYRDVLGRDPDPGGLDFWQTRFDEGMPRRQLALGFLRSQERRALLVTELYGAYLRRAPDPGGLQAHRDALASWLTEEALIAALVSSDEYFGSQCGSGMNGYVIALYRDLLARQPSDDEREHWLSSGLARDAMALAFVGSDEFHARTLESFYAHYLGRAPDPEGLADWIAALAGGVSFLDARAGFLTSDEYYASCDTGGVQAGGMCGDVDESGTCRGNVSVYCDPEAGLVEEDCSKFGATCIDAACQGGDDGDGAGAPCDEVTGAGRCTGSVLEYCDAGELVIDDCSAYGTTCGVIEDGSYDCF